MSQRVTSVGRRKRRETPGTHLAKHDERVLLLDVRGPVDVCRRRFKVGPDRGEVPERELRVGGDGRARGRQLAAVGEEVRQRFELALERGRLQVVRDDDGCVGG